MGRASMPEAAKIFSLGRSDEFRAYRDQLRSDLTRPNVEVKVQEDFKDQGRGALDARDVCIAGCDAVVHLAGDMTGSSPGEPAVSALGANIPISPRGASRTIRKPKTGWAVRFTSSASGRVEQRNLRSRRRLSRGAAGIDARAGSARLGDDAEQSRQCPSGARRPESQAPEGGRRPIYRTIRVLPKPDISSATDTRTTIACRKSEVQLASPHERFRASVRPRPPLPPRRHGIATGKGVRKIFPAKPRITH